MIHNHTQISSHKKRANKWLSALLAGSVLLFSAHSSQAADLIYGTEYLDYRLPKSVTAVCEQSENYNCPQIEIVYADTSQPWINTIINSRINQMLPGPEGGYTAAERPPMLAKSMVKSLLDGFAKSQLEDIPESSSLHYSFSAEPSYLGHFKDIELFEINTDIYLAGAHGLPYSEFMMLESNTRRQIGLEDILQAGKKQAFEKLAYQQYQAWVKSNDMDFASHIKTWPFELSDNILLTHEGVVIRYQPYQIAAYVYGMPELTVPYSKLNGILKAKYLPR